MTSDEDLLGVIAAESRKLEIDKIYDAYDTSESTKKSGNNLVYKM